MGMSTTCGTFALKGERARANAPMVDMVMLPRLDEENAYTNHYLGHQSWTNHFGESQR